eukprot:COSAG05_NODE_60_length_23142_cov_25.372130_12_plen_68_part_00
MFALSLGSDANSAEIVPLGTLINSLTIATQLSVLGRFMTLLTLQGTPISTVIFSIVSNRGTKPTLGL